MISIKKKNNMQKWIGNAKKDDLVQDYRENLFLVLKLYGNLLENVTLNHLIQRIKLIVKILNNLEKDSDEEQLL